MSVCPCPCVPVPGRATIRAVQLTLLLRWPREFQQEQEQEGTWWPSTCPGVWGQQQSRVPWAGDTLNQQHQLFEEYQGPCCQALGRDQPWAIGTLLSYLKIYKEPMSTPKNTKSCVLVTMGLMGAVIRHHSGIDPASIQH
ncbi:sphingomyelin phosphodiesterase 5-like isoform X2 [Manacus candei]|uniref:sphingomyelin phosphodiesterase 5-like isoform X2 n=1 Tax=Manacus candei TaxID=415023 RepID=UPI002225E9D2|nr:sphingomyelin phosphodiesterase 5-like isoform X2 [Manacus candei]